VNTRKAVVAYTIVLVKKVYKFFKFCIFYEI